MNAANTRRGCSIRDCPNPANGGMGLCAGHLKRLKSGQCVDERLAVRKKVLINDPAGILADYQSGLKVTDILDKWKIHSQDLYRLMREHNVRPRGYVGKLRSHLPEIQRAREAGEAIGTIAKRYNVSRQRISFILIEAREQTEGNAS